jgi:NTE family protein
MERVVLVLGGGGVKGLAQVGAWRAIEESGLEVAEIVGTSIGALVGASIAAGAGWKDMAPRALSLQRKDLVALNRWALLLNGVRQPSLFLEEPLREYIAAALPAETFDELEIPLGVNAVDFETGENVWFGAGGRMDVPLADAIYASCALPVFYPPAEIGGRWYVDGGVADTLPIERAAERGADLIIAVDVAAGPTKDPAETIGKGMIAIHHRVYDIQAYARRRALLDGWSGPPLIYVRPRLDGCSTFDFGNTRFFLEEGYRAAAAALRHREWSAALPAD